MRRKRMIAVVGFLIVVAAIFLVFHTTQQPLRPDSLRDEAKQAAYSNIVVVARNLGAAGAPLPDQAALARIVRDPMEAPSPAYRAETLFSMTDYPAIKGLAQAILAKGRDAEGRGQYREAADGYLTVLELGANCEHGPLIFFFVGAAIEQLGLRSLKTVIPKLSNEEIPVLARRIQSINLDERGFTS